MKKAILLLICLPAILTASAQNALPPAMKAAFDRIIDAKFKPDEPGGTVLIAKKGEVIYTRGFGMANLELGVRMQPDMVFQTGSMTKQFTAICILQLAEQGKLKVTDPLSNYITDSPDAWKPVTLENLMTHSSGIADQPNWQNFSVNDLITNAKGRPLAYTPGTKVAYNNIEFMLLGKVIEKASGMSYRDYLKQYILQPLGMQHTYYNDNMNIIPERVPCYIKTRNGSFANINAGINPSAAGALLSNTRDMLIWNQGLVTGKLVKKETLEKAWTPYRLHDGSASRFGYGWQVGGEIQDSPIIEHSGIATGYATEAFYMPKEEVYVAVFLNQRGIIPEVIAEDLAATLIGKPYQMQEISLSDERLQAYSGVYEDSDSVKRTLTVTDHHLYYQRTDGPKLRMIPYAPDQFYFDNTSSITLIKRDAQGQVTGLESRDKRYLSAPGQILKKL